MKVLSIGNSFSQDAHRYIHQVAKSYGKEIVTVNLYIPGCSLERHYGNMQTGVEDYEIELNGQSTGEKISLQAALQKESWDVVTLQQCSALSGRVPTYEPYWQALADFVRKNCPAAKLYVHQTWVYEEGCDMLKGTAGFDSADEMYYAVRNAYNLAARRINADEMIPCGNGMFYMERKGVKTHRDFYHASLGVGRYLLALIWYGTLTGEKVEINDFNDFDEEVSLEEKRIAVEAAQYALSSPHF